MFTWTQVRQTAESIETSLMSLLDHKSWFPGFFPVTIYNKLKQQKNNKKHQNEMNNFPKWVRICQINKLQNVLLYIYIYIVVCSYCCLKSEDAK